MPFHRSSEDSLDQAFHELVEGDFRAKWEATKSILEIGPTTIAELVLLVEDDTLDWEVRWFAARALGLLDAPEALEALIQLLRHTQEPDLIAIAAEGLSRFEDKGVNALVQLLAAPRHRQTAIHALAQIPHETVLEPLLSVTQDPDAEVRAMAISAIANFRNPQVDTVLIAALRDPAATVRQEAVTHLGVRPYLLETLDLTAKLVPGLWDISLAVNQASAIALGRLGTATAIAHLARVLVSPHTPEPLQISIVRALGWTEQASSLQALVSAYPVLPLTVQLETIEVLTRWETPAFRQTLGDLLGQWLVSLLPTPSPSSGKLKRAIALAIGTLQPPDALSLLQQLAHDPDAQTRLYAEAAIRQLSAPSDPAS